MTIIEPNKERSRWRGFVLLLVATVALGSVVNIWLYAATVDARHQLSRAENERQELTVAIAELKDTLYQRLGTENLNRAVAELGLVLEKKPRYIRVTSD